MGNNLAQIRLTLLSITGAWLGLTVVISHDLEVVLSAMIVAIAATALYWLIPIEDSDAPLTAYALGLLCLGAAAMPGVVLAHRAGLLANWWAPLAVGVPWLTTLALLVRAYHRLIIVPSGVMHVYTGPLGDRRVEGFQKIPPPHPAFGRLLARVPIRDLKLDVAIPEVGTTGDEGSRPAPHHSGERGPPEWALRPGRRNIHRLRLVVEFGIVPETWWLVLKIPSGTLVGAVRAYYGAPGPSQAMCEPRYWEELATAYVQEAAEEAARELVRESGWSAEEAWRNQETLGKLIRVRLRQRAPAYGLAVHSVRVFIEVDSPEALSRKRALELLGDTWQQQRGQVLATFQTSLRDLNLQLTPDEIEQLTRTHLRDIAAHLRHYGQLDDLAAELAAELHSPASGTDAVARQRR